MPGHPGPGGDGPRGACLVTVGQVRPARWSAIARVGVVAVLTGVLTGCAARQSSETANRLPRDAGSSERQPELPAPGASASGLLQAPHGTARIELSDVTLARTLKALDGEPTSEAYRRVAVEYRRLQVFDRAHEFFTEAIKSDPKNAAAFDGLARTWRDWGLPRLGLSHAYMAVYLAPDWAASQNTLGTLLYVLGNGTEARRRFERAITIDPHAAYALNNLCYLSFTEGDETRAMAECTEALTRAPGLTAARNNLALVHAAAGRLALTEREFLSAGSRGIGFYNLGIVHMARRDYPKAVVAFETAFRETPSLWEADVRAREARTLAARPQGPSGPMRN
ncbi:MAG TPA: tetratricopeptide repeat protein [Vicinamibacterales bacterium]|nr:tetratricopeptide repeat protein [Vicinamibacterales bacterium]